MGLIGGFKKICSWLGLDDPALAPNGEQSRQQPNDVHIRENEEQLRMALQQRESQFRLMAQRSQLLSDITLRIRQSLDIAEILQATVVEVRQLLQADRVLFFQLQLDGSGSVVQESVVDPVFSIMGQTIFDPCFGETYIERYRQDYISQTVDIEVSDLQPCYVDFLRQFNVRSNLVVPVLLGEGRGERGEEGGGGDRGGRGGRGDRGEISLSSPSSLPSPSSPPSLSSPSSPPSLSSPSSPHSSPLTPHSSPNPWGLLIAHQCTQPRHWSDLETDLLRQIANQVGMGIRQASLYEQAQVELAERKRAEATLQQQANQEQAFNRLLQSIRTSLDLDTIFSAATQEFSDLLQTDRTGIIRYLPERRCWLVAKEYLRSASAASLLGMEIPDDNNPITAQLKRREVVLVGDTNALDDPVNQKVAQQLPGIWLIMPLEVNGIVWGCLGAVNSSGSFTQENVHLARRIADQLAIAIQQANLYQQVQAELAERKRAEVALQRLNNELEQRVEERTAQLTLALSAARMGIWEWEITTDAQHWSTENYALLGFSAGEDGRILDDQGMVVAEVPTHELFMNQVHPDDQERVEQEAQDILQQRVLAEETVTAPYESEYRIVWQDGTVRWNYTRGAFAYNDQGHPIKLVGVSLDVTERKQAEAALQASEHRFRTLIEDLQVGVLVQSPEGQIQLCNPKALELLELTQDELLNRTSLDPRWNVVREDGSIFPTLEYPLNVASITRKSVKDVIMGVYRPISQNRIWLLVAAEPQMDGQGNLKQVICTFSDVSDRKRAEESLRQLAGREHLLRTVTQQIHQSLNLDTILTATVTEVRQMLKADRALIFHLTSEASGVVLKEAVLPEYPVTAEMLWEDECFPAECYAYYQQGTPRLVPDVAMDEWTSCLVEFMQEAGVKSKVIAPIVLSIEDTLPQIWGLLVVHSCSHYRQWEQSEAMLLQQIANQLAIAIQKSNLYHQLQIELSERRRAEATLRQQLEREQVFLSITQRIRESLDLQEILQRTVEEVRQVLQSDRVLVYRILRDGTGSAISESVVDGFPEILGRTYPEETFPSEKFDSYLNGHIGLVCDRTQDEVLPCLVEFLAEIQVQAKLVVPIVQKDFLWGLLIAHQCSAPRQWQPWEIALLQQIASQLAIAIQQSNLYHQLQSELTERRQIEAQLRTSLREKEVLLKEVHHRVKNNLQVISSMLWLQTRAAPHPTVSSALADTRNRLQAMALIHETLYQSNDLGQLNFHDYIQRLANSILSAHSIRSNQIHLSFQLQPVMFNLETAIPCGLLLNELITNAIKHAFPDSRRGEVHIVLEQLPVDEPPCPTVPTISQTEPAATQPPPRYMLTIQDNGIGIPANLDIKNLKSLGLKIAYDLALQLRGTLNLDQTSGTRFQLTFSVLEYRKRF